MDCQHCGREPQSRGQNGNLEGLHHWRYHCCSRKSCGSHQIWDDTFLLGENRVGHDIRGFMIAEQGSHGRDGGCGKKVRSEGSQDNRSWRKSRANRLRTEQKMAWCWEEGEINWPRQPGRRVPSIQERFGLVLGHEPFSDRSTEKKAKVDLALYSDVFREMNEKAKRSNGKWDVFP